MDPTEMNGEWIIQYYMRIFTVYMAYLFLCLFWLLLFCMFIALKCILCYNPFCYEPGYVKHDSELPLFCLLILYYGSTYSTMYVILMDVAWCESCDGKWCFLKTYWKQTVENWGYIPL